MDKKEILEAYLSHNGFTRVNGESWDLLLPFLMMDCVRQLFDDTIKQLPLRHEAKRYKTMWVENYNKMNQSFFRSFNDGQRDDVIDMMDEFEEWIKNDLDRLRFSFMATLPVDDIESKKIIAACLATSALTRSAEFIFNNRLGKLKPRYGDPRKNLELIKVAAIKIANTYYNFNKNFNANEVPSLSDNLQGLCNRMVGFLTK